MKTTNGYIVGALLFLIGVIFLIFIAISILMTAIGEASAGEISQYYNSFCHEIQFNAMVSAVIMAESSGKSHAVGDSGGARGLMQIKKDTWSRYTKIGWENAFNAKINRYVGESILKDITKRYGRNATPAKVIYTYNTGRFVKHIPRWTKRHPNRIYRAIFLHEINHNQKLKTFKRGY